VNNDKFCQFCGKEKARVPSGYFGPQTGLPVYKTVCEDACLHNLHDWEFRPLPWWNIFLGRSNLLCRKCGVRDSVD